MTLEAANASHFTLLAGSAGWSNGSRVHARGKALVEAGVHEWIRFPGSHRHWKAPMTRRRMSQGAASSRQFSVSGRGRDTSRQQWASRK